jgi:hypothetical protein
VITRVQAKPSGAETPVWHRLVCKQLVGTLMLLHKQEIAS